MGVGVGVTVVGFQAPNQAVPKLPTQRNAKTQHFIHPILPGIDEEPRTLPRPWAQCQAPGPPCYK